MHCRTTAPLPRPSAVPHEKYMQDRDVQRVGRDRRGYMCRIEYRAILPGEMGGGAAHMQMHAWDQWCGLCPGFYLKYMRIHEVSFWHGPLHAWGSVDVCPAAASHMRTEGK